MIIKLYFCNAIIETATSNKLKIKIMKNLAINPELISDNNTFSFKNVPSMYDGFTDVFYKGQRIAIINGLSAPLQWTAKNGSNIPVKVIEQLENMVIRMIKQTSKQK